MATGAVLGAGLVVGAAVRFATAGVIGANIGGGPALVFAFVVTPVAIVFAVTRLQTAPSGSIA
jgi:hypothetical protein